MKKYVLITLLLFASYGLFSQSITAIDYFNWSNPITYNLSPSPIITGYGYYSDSLSKEYNGKTFFEHNEEYYLIESWADYYYWYVNKFSYQFNDPDLYKYYYWINDNYGMVTFIVGDKYKAQYYPSLITVNFGDLNVEHNRLKDTKYIAINKKQISKLNQSNKNSNNISTSTSVNQNISSEKERHEIARENQRVPKGISSTNTNTGKGSIKSTKSENSGHAKTLK